MSFEAHITKMDERPVPKLWLAKPDFTIIERINGVSNLSAKMNYMNENEISFEVNSHLFDEFTNEQYRNPTIEKMRNKYLIKMSYNNQTEWFIIENFSKTSDDKDYVPTTAKYIGSELDKKWVGDIEEIGVTPAQLFNKFLPAVAPNWSIRSIDEKLANVKREYTTSDASISTLIEEVCKAIDAVVVFHNRDRQFSFVHRDNAGKFKGLKVKEATYLKGFTDEQNSENLTTRLVLFGKEGLTINSVNPAGTDYIEDFSYYMKPFRRDSRRNVLEHSDYMSDALCHALLDFEEYFKNKTGDYEKLSEQYTKLLKEQLEEEFKLTEITAIKQRLEDRVELLKPQGNYIEKRILGNTSFDFKYNTRYIMVIQNNGTTARLTLNGEEQIIAGGQSGYFKMHTPPQVTNEDPQIRHTLQVLSASPNLMASLSTASEADYAEEDVLEIEKKFNVYKYRELYTYQVGILAAVERRIKEYDNQRQSINDSLAVDTFFPPALVKERENFINWGVWREEDHTDAKALLEDGLKQLKEHNNVERTVTVSLIDFIQSLEDKENWDKLSAGDKIQFSNKIYDANMEAFVSELNINFDNHDVSVTLSNIIDLKDRARGIAQKMASFVSSAGQINLQKSQLEDQLHKSNQVIALLEGEWDANKRRITAANETVSIDNRGIIITSPTHPNEMLVAVAGVIAISNDGGETFKQAINTRGVVAERLIGKVLIGTELVMENNAGTFRFDNEGFRINASNFHLISDDGEDYFDTLMRRLQQEIVTAEEKISEEIKQQGESLKSEINDVDQSLMDYTAGLINALADGLLTEQEIHSLKLQLNMLEADYSQVARRVRPILFDSALDPVIQEELYVSYYRLDDDYQTLVSFIRSLEEPTEVPQETINNILALLKRFKPAIEELVAMIETALTNTQRNRIANAEYNSNTFAENLANDLNDEVTDLKESLKGLNDSLEDALSDGIITTVEKSQLSDALMRFESEKQDVDNRFHNTYNHAHIVGTANQVSLQAAKTAYNSAYSTLIAKVKQILNMTSVSHAIVEEYKALYQAFTLAVVTYSEEYERAVEFIQKGYADTAEGEAKKYTDGLRMEVEADVKDIQDNIVDFEADVYGAFKDGIITEQERNRLGIHHDMLEKEKSDLIERYDTIITSDYLQGFYDVEQLVTTRSLYGQVHADLLLALELAMMDSKITKEESQEATRLFALYVQRLTQFSKELELAIAALGESKAVAHTNEQLNNYMSLSVFNDEIAMLQAEIDGHIMTWYYNHEPTLSTLPASEWKDDKTRNAHVGDLFYHETEGHAFRFMRKSGGGYEWQLIKDTEVTKALSDAQNALDLADDKRRVFVAQPTPPYDIGDLWIKGDGELMRARVNKEGKTQFSDLDWVKATKYTDDTVANQVGNQLNDYKTTNNREIQDLRETLGAFKQTVEGVFKDGIVAEYELKILKTQMQSLDREKADVDAGYNQLLNHPNLTGAPKTKLQSAYTGFAETHNNLTAAINRVITDGVITEPEYEEVMGLLDSYPIALTTYKNVMNETYLHLIKMAQDVADGALDIAGRLDIWKSSSFELDSEKIATRVGESSWETKWQPVVEQGINDAVDGIEVGGRNLLLNSNTQYETSVYNIADYPLSEAIQEGTQVTISVKGELNPEKEYFGVYNSGGSVQTATLRPASQNSNGVYVLTFNWRVGATANDFLRIYHMPNSVTGVTSSIDWVKLEYGNKATDWTPAPEDIENQFKTINSNAYGLNEELTKVFKDGIISESEATAIGDSINLVKSDYENVIKRYTNVYANTGLTGTAKTNLLSARNAYNTSYNSLVNHITAVISSGKITSTQRATYNTLFSDYRVKIGVLSDAIESAWDAIVNKKSGDAANSAVTDFYNTTIKSNYSTTTQTKELLGSYVTSTEMQGNLDKIATYANSYNVGYGSGELIREANGSVFDDAYSYEVTAHSVILDGSLLVAVLDSKGKGKGWNLEILEEKGTTGSHPRIYFSGDYPAITKWGTGTKSEVQVVYTKYAGSFTNLSKTNSMIEQKADEITSRVESTLATSGSNMIPDSDFSLSSSPPSSWSSYGGDAYLNSTIRFGKAALVQTYSPRRNASTSIGLVSDYLTYNVISGREYTLSFSGQTGSAASEFTYCYLLNSDGVIRDNGTTNNMTLPNPKNLGEADVNIATSSGNFTRYSITFTPDWTGRAKILIGAYIPADVYTYIYLADPKIEKGSIATPYSPASADDYGRYSEIKQTAEGISSEVSKKVGTASEIVSRINQTSEKITIDADKIDLSANSKISLAIKKSVEDLDTGSNMLRNTQPYDENLRYMSGINGSTTSVAPQISTLDGTRYILGRENSGATSSYISVSIGNSASINQTMRIEQGKQYTFSFVARTSGWAGTMSYTYLMRRESGGNQGLGTPKIYPSSHKNAHRYVYTFTASWTSDYGYVLIGTRPTSTSPGGQWIRFRDVMFQEGNLVAPYAPHPDEIAASNRIIAAINMDNSGTRISGDKVSITANDISIDGKTISIGSNPAITGLNSDVRDAQSQADAAKSQADAARVGNNIASALNSSKTTVNISGDRINIDGTQIQLGGGASRSINAELKNARDGANIAASINSAPTSVRIMGDHINLIGNVTFEGIETKANGLANGSTKVSPSTMSDWGMTSISGGKIQTDQMTAKRIKIVRDDGVEVVNNGRLKNDMIVSSFSPAFMSESRGTTSNWEIFYQRGSWWHLNKDETGYDRTEPRRFNAYSFNHSARYLMVEVALNSPSNGTGLFLQLDEFSAPSGVTAFNESKGWTRENMNGNYYTFQIDLGSPTFKRRNFYLRGWPNSQGTNSSVTQFRILRMTQNDDSWY